MGKITRDFISEEPRQYRLRIGRTIASSLSGFVVGVICASIIWMVAINNFL